MSVVVFGSINIDLTATVDRFPDPGETLAGREFSVVAGGKGANQAVAAAKLGAVTDFVGRVGRDEFGDRAGASLKAAGVRPEGLFVEDGQQTGVALIFVDRAGENKIVVVRGTNERLDDSDVARLRSFLQGATAFLIQLELPLNTAIAAIRAAKAAGVPVILDPAPAVELPAELYPLIDTITPNEGEAKVLTGIEVCDPETAATAATILQERGVRNAIVKLGKQGAFCATSNHRFFVPAFEVETVDTVAAGDGFNGALAAALDSGESFEAAVRRATAAAAISVTRAGAQPSLATAAEVEDFLKARD